MLIKRRILSAISRNHVVMRMRPPVPTVYLTFDDGPHSEYTPRLLALLDAFGVRATFFVVGENVRANPEVSKAIVARGIRLGPTRSPMANRGLSPIRNNATTGRLSTNC